MSRAFVKEDGGGRWEAPSASKAYQVLWAAEPGTSEVLRESDDLLELLHWMEKRSNGRFEVRARSGELLAQWEARAA